MGGEILFTILRDKEINVQIASKYIKKHTSMIDRFDKLDAYYRGNHEICKRKRRDDLPNNKVVINHAKYISDIASGYLAGTPVSYKSSDDIKSLTDLLKIADSSTQDSDLALDGSIFGRSFELIYMSDDEKPVPKLAKIDPRCAFVVYDDTVAHEPVFGMVYYSVFDDDDKFIGYSCTLYTADFEQHFVVAENYDVESQDELKENIFGMVQLNEIWNNPTCQGDFEPVISLIDAYNTLASNRLNDKDQFIDALLVLYGAVLGDNSEEKIKNYKSIKETGTIEFPAEAKAEYLTRQFDEASVEILRKSFKKDIHAMSFVPDMSDENFCGNSSGVAMSYKILAFELMTKTKERFFKEGLKYRLKLFYRILELRGQAKFDLNNVEIIMSRSLPSNVLETANIVATLQGICSKETLISQLPFVDNPTDEIDKLKEEQKKSIEYQQSLFAVHDGDGNDINEE